MKQITHPELVRSLKKSGAVILAELSPTDCDLLHMAIGISGEAAEILECFQNARFQALEFEHQQNLKEELGDMEFYLEGFRQAIGLDHGTVLQWAADHGSEAVIPDSAAPTFAQLGAALCVWAGKFLDEVKRAVIYRKPVVITSLIAPLAAMETILRRIRYVTGLPRGIVLEANQAKLSVRYQGLYYSDKAAQERADKPEEKGI